MTTQRKLTRTLRRAALALTLVVGAGAAPSAPVVRGQDLPERGLPAPGDGFTWERVGDVGIDVFDLAFGGDGTLYATASNGPYRLDLSGGLPGVWELLYDSGQFSGAILPLGRGADGDTLLATTSITARRSTDGGHTWEVVYSNPALQSGPLYEVPPGLPHAGRIIVASYRDGAYSDDRGSSWVLFEPATLGGLPAGAEGFLALPPGSAHPGRIVAATRYGAALSDDGGASFYPSALWDWAPFGEALAAAEVLGGGGGAVGGPNALMGGRVSGEADNRAWVSADGGETWGPGSGGVRLPEGPPAGIGWPEVELVALGRSSALMVLGRGTVYRTDDGGETWVPVGRAPEIADYIYAIAAAVGPDGRLYVGLKAGGTERGWVWRTAEVVVASEPPPEPEPEGLGVEVAPNPFRGEVGVALVLPEAADVEAVLYDALGRRVAILASGVLPAGRHEVALDASHLPAGVYVVRVAAGGAVASRLVTLAGR